jgi:hypothetical protein
MEQWGGRNEVEVPSRDGLDLDDDAEGAGFWYDVFGGGQHSG